MTTAPIKNKTPPAMISHSLDAKPKPNEHPNDAAARTVLNPVTLNAITIHTFSDHFNGQLVLQSLVNQLAQQTQAVRDNNMAQPEVMLVAQAHTLDAIFNQLAQKSALTLPQSTHTAELYLRLALKAQSQCRATLEALSNLKNPPQVAFVQQANIANQQQINNGVASSLPEKNHFPQNKLLEAATHAPLDVRAPRAASTTDSSMAAMDPIHRSKID